MSNLNETPKSDLRVRTLSAVVMFAVAGGAFWADGMIFFAFVGLIGIALLTEWIGLALKITPWVDRRALWIIGGIFYIGIACLALLAFSSPFFGRTPAFIAIGAVIATDIGAYFTGRNFGGPKIAPAISPSKTWSGLIGGMITSAVLVTILTYAFDSNDLKSISYLDAVKGAAIAIIAQAGDFFESWMKRRAGVKDSGNIIPGHGGILDRADGMVAVFFFGGSIFLFGAIFV
jgi:phosphatidate cytidylyltransferase